MRVISGCLCQQREGGIWKCPFIMQGGGGGGAKICYLNSILVTVGYWCFGPWLITGIKSQDNLAFAASILGFFNINLLRQRNLMSQDLQIPWNYLHFNVEINFKINHWYSLDCIYYKI